MTEATPEEALARYEANKMQYLTRAGEELGYDGPMAAAAAVEAVRNPAGYRGFMHRLAKYIARHEPAPDPNEALKRAVNEILEEENWDSVSAGFFTEAFFILINRLRAAGLLKEGA